MKPIDPVVVGCIEHVDLPEWGIRGLRGKIDTGARTSALHVENIRELGDGRVKFDVRLHRKNMDRRVHVVADIARTSRVRPSSGDLAARIVVETTLRLGTVERRIEIGLVDRTHMMFRLLLGRSAFTTGVLIDPGKRYLLGRNPRRRDKAAAATSR